MYRSNNYKINNASCNGHNIFPTIKSIFLLGDVWTRFYFRILLDGSQKSRICFYMEFPIFQF